MKKALYIITMILWIILATALTLITYPLYVIGGIFGWLSKILQWPFHWLGLYGAIVERKLKV